jgi:folate-binding protein YgfZ
MTPSPDTRCFELKNQTQLLFTGPDRLRYLNGQVTQDLRKLSIGRALPACVTNAKGRLQAAVWIADLSGALLVDAHPDVAETLPARLERYIVADDVSLENQTLSHTLFHCLNEPPVLPGITEATVVRSSRLGVPGWDLRVPNAVLQETRMLLGVSEDSRLSWEQLRISHGIPAWGAELSEDTLPPEAGLDQTHVDYHKGCYIGQEVLSRIKSVGHVNRRLVVLSAAATGDLRGSKLFDPADPARDSQHSIGHITSIVRLEAGSAALAYLKRGADFRVVVSESGTAFEVRELHQETSIASSTALNT